MAPRVPVLGPAVHAHHDRAVGRAEDGDPEGDGAMIGADPLHREELEFENVELAVRSYK